MMPSDLAERFIRVNYDDSRSLPWVIMWGEDHELKSCRTRENALRQAKELQDICDVFHEWAQTKP